MKALPFIVLLVVGTSAQAQLPRWTLDIAGGDGRHTTVTASSWFFDDSRGVARFTGAARVAGQRALAAYVEAEFLPDFGVKVTASCQPAPNGGCWNTFGPGAEVSLGPAVRYAIGSLGTLGVGAGIGRGLNYAGPSDFRTNTHADVAINVFPHVAATMQYRYVRWSSKGERYWFAPLTFGGRVF